MAAVFGVGVYLVLAVLVWLARRPVLCGALVLAAVAWSAGPVWFYLYLTVVAAVLVLAVVRGAERRHLSGTDALLIALSAGLRVVWCLVRHPAATAVLAALVWAATVSALAAIAVVSVLVGGLIGWWGIWPDSFARWPGLAFWSAWRTIGYRWRWRKVMLLARLGVRLDGTEELPRCLAVRSTRWRDVLTVEMLPSQFPLEWEVRTEALTHGFRARSCRVTSPQPGFVTLALLRGDPLRKVLTPPAIGTAVDVRLDAVPVGLTDQGEVWCLPVSGRHTLVGGSSDSGKSSVVWSLLAGVAPAIRDGWVEAWGIDPKGMELAAGEGLFSRYAYPKLDEHGDIGPDSVRPMVDLLKDAARLMLARGEALHGVARQHTPGPGDPAVIVIIDEIVFFGQIPYPELRKEAHAALTVLLSQGRSAGVSVVVCTQDPRKESVPSRHFFTSTVALRCREREEVKLLLGDGAWERGAVCDQIPGSTPGVGYVLRDGEREPTRVRAFYYDDPAVAALADTYRPPRQLHVIDTDATPQDTQDGEAAA